MQQHEPKPENDILSAIAGKKVAMRPKWQFALNHVGIAVAIIVVALGLVYVGSFIGYLWRSARFSALPIFGYEGYALLARSFPWWQGVLVLLGGVAFIFVARKTTHLYRWPLAMIVGVFLLAFLAAAFITDTTRVHDHLANQAFEASIPIVGPLYRSHMRLAHGLVTPGVIERITAQGLYVQTGTNDVFVTVLPTTKMPYAWSPVIGEEIVVLGQWDGETITAFGIRPAEQLPSRRPFRMHMESERIPGVPAY